MDVNIPLTLVHHDSLGDWYTIERAEHDGREWSEEVEPGCFVHCMSARISDACVEGAADEMLAIAKAIRENSRTSFRRCAVDARGDAVEFWSPRNSQRPGVVTKANALDLADEIERKLVNQKLESHP